MLMRSLPVKFGLVAALLLPIAAPFARASAKRPHREISSQELLQAIRVALKERAVLNYDDLKAESLRLQTVVKVANEDSGLRVVKVEYDPIRHETRFRLRLSTEPRRLAFYVTAPNWRPLVRSLVAQRDLRAGEEAQPQDFATEQRVLSAGGDPADFTLEEVAGWQLRRRIRRGEIVRRGYLKLATLARPGHPAILTLEHPNLRISGRVLPLQPGGKGQHIRIRSLWNGKVLTAEVVAPHALRATF